jgi:hypothetical protein
MSPELEILDQLVGGDMLVCVLRQLFQDEEHFIRATTWMLNQGEIQLIDQEGAEVPAWNWKHALRKSLETPADEYRLSITLSGCRRFNGEQR